MNEAENGAEPDIAGLDRVIKKQIEQFQVDLEALSTLHVIAYDEQMASLPDRDRQFNKVLVLLVSVLTAGALLVTVVALRSVMGVVRRLVGAEESLSAKERALTTLVGHLPGMVCRYSGGPNPRLEFASGGCAELTGYQADTLAEEMCYDELIHPEDLERWRESLIDAARKAGGFEVTYRIRTPEGLKWVWERGTCTCDDSGLDGCEIESFVTDVTAGTLAELSLRDSLTEKELMLTEIHHRVKNNLQVVSSLLYLQAQELEDDEARRTLTDSQSRVYSMAAVHEMLYRSGDLAHINLSDYVGELTRFMSSGWASQSRVIITPAVDDIQIGVDQAINIGLMIAELVMNALEHGFPNGTSGQVWVRMGADSVDTVVLEIADDGVGIGDDFDPAEVRSLGWRLVRALAGRMGGRLITIDGTAGTMIRFEFPTDEMTGVSSDVLSAQGASTPNENDPAFTKAPTVSA